MVTINDVTYPVLFYPICFDGVISKPITSKVKLDLGIDPSHYFIDFLKQSYWGSKIEKDFKLQVPLQQVGSTKLLTATATSSFVIKMMLAAASVGVDKDLFASDFNYVVVQVEKWVKDFGCNEVVINFVDAREATDFDKYVEIEDFVGSATAGEIRERYDKSNNASDMRMAIQTHIASGKRQDLEKQYPEWAGCNPANHDWS